MLTSTLNWLAPAATIVAAMMTAANFGARITGCGFAVFLIASIGWTILGITTGQTSLVYANGFLIIVNAIGIWRWLGREAGYEKGAKKAAARSTVEKVPTLFSFNALAGTDIVDTGGQFCGTIVDVMGESKSREIAYFVVSEGGLGGVGEKLHAVPASSFDLSSGEAKANFDAAYLQNLPILEPGAWPTTLSDQST